MSIEDWCRTGHDAYEAKAAATGQETRADSRTAWENVPEARKGLMRAAYAAVIETHVKPLLAEAFAEGVRQGRSPVMLGNHNDYAARITRALAQEE